jgi:hypothetical protein
MVPAGGHDDATGSVSRQHTIALLTVTREFLKPKVSGFSSKHQANWIRHAWPEAVAAVLTVCIL